MSHPYPCFIVRPRSPLHCVGPPPGFQYKGMKVLRRDTRFREERGMSTDIERVLIDTLHAPMRMNEKVLYFLYSKAYENRNKKQAQPLFDIMTKKIRALGALGEGWGPGWEGKENKKLASFALPCDQSKRIFNLEQLPALLEVVNIACTGRTEEHAKKMGSFLSEYLEVLAGRRPRSELGRTGLFFTNPETRPCSPASPWRADEENACTPLSILFF